MSAKTNTRKTMQQQVNTTISELTPQLPVHMKKLIWRASEKGTSSWLTTLPTAEFGFKGVHSLMHLPLGVAGHQIKPPKLCMWHYFLCGPCTILLNIEVVSEPFGITK